MSEYDWWWFLAFSEQRPVTLPTSLLSPYAYSHQEKAREKLEKEKIRTAEYQVWNPWKDQYYSAEAFDAPIGITAISK